ncbi:MAG TPA: hypothetical protein VK970_01435, partial [Candidatus Methylacidiphilales bacterium]|nr:hypothetical protein [Candidatus Methylacidiphilales bacterium]
MKRTIFSLVERGTGVAVLTLLWLLCPNGTVFAQPDKPPVPLPAGPLIQKRMPAMAQWTISTVVTTPSDKADKSGKAETAARTTSESPQPESAKSAKALVVLEQTYTKTQDIVRMEYVDGAKQQWTVWSAQGFQILVPPDGKGCGEVTISLVKDIP